jgi:DNA-binding NtrC family response regulator
LAAISSSATHRDLAHGVATGSFRQDLYYRLKVVELNVPSLRARREDILPLGRVLLADAALRMKRKISALSPSAADQLLRYEWPGNVRELDNAMERAAALARGSRSSSRTCLRRSVRRFPGRSHRAAPFAHSMKWSASTSSRRWR